MPEILVAATDHGDHATIVYREQVTPADLQDDHMADRLIERVGWAIVDAEQTEHDSDAESSMRGLWAASGRLSPLHRFVIESQPPTWRFVGHGDGETPSAALQQFSGQRRASDAEFRLKDPSEPTADWTYLTMIDGTPVERP